MRVLLRYLALLIVCQLALVLAFGQGVLGSSGPPAAQADSEVTEWEDLISAQMDWLELLDEEPMAVPSDARALHYGWLLELHDDYVEDHGSSLRLTFRRALYVDVHRRFLRQHDHRIETDEGPNDPMDLYDECKEHAQLEDETWGDDPLEEVLDRWIQSFEVALRRPDPDPDIASETDWKELEGLGGLYESRTEAIRVLQSDSQP